MKRLNLLCSLSAIGIIIVLLFLLNGCRSRKEIGDITPSKEKTEIVFQEHFAALLTDAQKFRTLSAKTDVKLRMENKTLSSRVDLKIVRDSTIMLSIQPFFGIEMFKVVFLPEQIILIDRMNKRFLSENYTELLEKLPSGLNFYNIQDLFCNRIFVPGENALSEKNFKDFHFKEDGELVQLVNEHPFISYIFITDRNAKLLSSSILFNEGEYALEWNYRKFRQFDTLFYPSEMDANLSNDKKDLGGLTINLSRIQTDIPVDIHTTLSSRYKRVTLSQILKSLQESNNK